MVLNSSFWPDLSIKSRYRCYWSSILSVNVFPFHAFNTFTVCTRGGWNSAIWGNYLLSTLILIKAKSKSVAFRTILKVASLILLKLFLKKMSGQFFICDVRLQKNFYTITRKLKRSLKILCNHRITQFALDWWIGARARNIASHLIMVAKSNRWQP